MSKSATTAVTEFVVLNLFILAGVGVAVALGWL